MINRKSMLKMKDGVILVNTGRGMLIDSADLVEALKDKKIGAVALDVYEEEEDYSLKINLLKLLKMIS